MKYARRSLTAEAGRPMRRSATNALQRPRGRIGLPRLVRPAPTPTATAADEVPQQQAGARGDRGQHEHRVQRGDRDPDARAEPGRGEGPGGDALPWPPATDAQGDDDR